MTSEPQISLWPGSKPMAVPKGRRISTEFHAALFPYLVKAPLWDPAPTKWIHSTAEERSHPTTRNCGTGEGRLAFLGATQEGSVLPGFPGRDTKGHLVLWELLRTAEWRALPLISPWGPAIQISSALLCQFPLAAGTNYHKSSSLKHYKCIISQFCRQEVQNGSHWAKNQGVGSPVFL